MPFYFRKSVSAGPFRFNFSKGGVGLSVGIKGLRIGTGPRGHYVHAGYGGIYYRASIGKAGSKVINARPSRQAASSEPRYISENTNVKMIEIDSSNVLEMREESHDSLINEINLKQKQAKMSVVFPWLTCGLSVLSSFIIGPTGILGCLAAFPAWAVGAWLDSFHRTAVVFYELDQEAEKAFEEVVKAFDGMKACMGKWHIEAGGAIQDLTTWKRNAGASHLVRKKPTILGYALPPVIKCNVIPPMLQVGRQVIYFFPDVALVQDKDTFGAVGYENLKLRWQDSNFIEEGVVPSDAVVIRHTWKYPNKDGGPDRRFNNNRQIPVCRYEAMHLSSQSGVNELVEFSKTGVSQPFANSLGSMPKRHALSNVKHLPPLH